MAMNDDPWTSIGKPTDSTSFVVRRADPEHPFEFFWGRDFLQRCLFLMKYNKTSTLKKLRTPNLKGLEIAEQTLADGGNHQLIIALKEQTNRDLFHRLCCDLLDGTRSCADERTAVATTISRLWRWQHLMKRGQTEKLSENEQKGLIGELHFIRDTLLALYSPGEALSFWQGPIAGEGEKDFSISDTAVEIKTRSGTAPAQVRISSEGQLDIGSYRELFLVVYEISAASENQDGNFNLHGLVGQIRDLFAEMQPEAIDIFEEKLNAYGYFDVHDYEKDRYIVLGKSIYQIQGSFPRIVQEDVPVGIHDLAYTLELIACKDFAIEEAKLCKLLEESK